MNHVQTGIYHVQPVFPYIVVCILVQNFVMICIYQAHTSNVQNYMSLHVFLKIKKLPCWRIEPKTSCIGSSCLNHCASSVDVKCFTVRVYVYCSTWRKSQRLDRWLVAVQLTGFQVTVVRIPDVLGPHRIGGQAGLGQQPARLSEPVILARSSRQVLPGVKLTWMYASQPETGGLVLHAQAGPAHTKTVCVGRHLN